MFKNKDGYCKLAGFTLIELLTTIGIIAVLATIGIINLANYRSPKILNMEADKIVAVLRDAQNRSMIQESGKPWGVYFEYPVTYDGYYSLFASSTYSASSVISSYTLNSAINFLEPALGATTSVAFASIIGKPDAAKTIKIALKSNSSVYITITVDAYGKIQY